MLLLIGMIDKEDIYVIKMLMLFKADSSDDIDPQ